MDEQKKGIGRGELIALIVSSCIGTGIFGITSDVAAAAAPGPALLAWIFVGIGFLMLVLSLNNLSEKRPDLTSGIFSYAGAGAGVVRAGDAGAARVGGAHGRPVGGISRPRPVGGGA